MSFIFPPSNTQEETCLDIAMNGFWGSCPERCFVDVRIFKGALYSLYKVSQSYDKHSVNGHLVNLILFMQFSTCKFGIHGNKHAHIAIIHPLT